MVVVVVVVGSGDEREKGSLVEGGVVCMKEWKRGQKVSLKKGGRWEKGNILEGRGSREHAWEDGREGEVREYIVKKREGRGKG